jgi:hypothetical protein
LTHLTIETYDTSYSIPLFDGLQLERFTKKLRLVKFDFCFTSYNQLHDEKKVKSLLELFRSSFWLEKKHWFVGASYDHHRIRIYSMPRFGRDFIQYDHEIDYTELSTVPPNVVKRMIYDSKVKGFNYWEPRFDQPILSPTYRFTNIETLNFNFSGQISLDRLISVVDLGQVKNISIVSFNPTFVNKLHAVLEHTTHLHRLHVQFHPSFIPPLHVRSYILYQQHAEKCVNSENIDAFCRSYSHVERLEIDIESLELLVELIDRLEHLEYLKINCIEYFDDNDYHVRPFDKSVSREWFQQNTRCLNENNFTCRIEKHFIEFAIGDR